VTFWQKDIGKKGVHKLLMKLTPGSDEMVEVEADECEIGGGIEGGPMSPM